MNWQTAVFVFSFLMVALFSLLLASRAWQRDRSAGSLTFSILMLVIVVWLIVVAGSLSSIDPAIKVFFAKVSHGCIAFVGLLWFAFAYEFTHPESRALERKGFWLWILPLASILVISTNDLHGWMWREIAPDPLHPGVLHFVRGPWYWIHISYNYLLILAGTVVLVRGLTNSMIFHKRQVAMLLGVLAIPTLSSVSFMVGWIPEFSIDPTPFALALTGLVYSWGLWQIKLFDPSPLAREVILEHIGEGYLALDQNNRVVDANLLAYKFLHLTGASVKGMPAELMLRGWPGLIKLLKSEAFMQMELQVGRSMTLEVSLAPWYNRAGRLAGRLLILDDISERKAIEERLRQSEQKYRHLVNASPVGIVTTDEKGAITFASPEMQQIYLDSQQPVQLGTLLYQLVHPDDRAEVEDRFHMLTATGDKLPSQEYRVLHKDGSIFWVEMTSILLEDGVSGGQGVLSIIRDVSWRKHLETRLQENLNQQTFMNDLLQLLYRPRDLNAALEQVIARTGAFAQFRRAYLCANSADGSEAWVRLEWCQEGTLPRSSQAPLFRFAALPSWKHTMENQGMILADQAQNESPLPEDLIEFMAVWNIQSLVALPVYGNDARVFGFLSFENCQDADGLSGDMLELLRNVGKLVSGALAMQQTAEAEARQQTIAEALRDTARLLNSTLNYEEVLDRILANLERLVRHDAASIALVEPDGLTLRYVRWRGYDAAGSAFLRNLHVSLDERATYGLMARSGEPMIIPDTSASDLWVRYDECNWVASYAGVAIMVQGEAVGFINLNSLEPNHFDPDLAEHLKVFADQAAAAIQNSRLYDAAHQRADEVEILYNIGLTLTEGLELEKVLTALFDQCRQVLPVDALYVALYDEDTSMINQALFYSHGQVQGIPPRNIKTNPGLTGLVINERRTIYLPDLNLPEVQQRYSIVYLDDTPTRSYLGAPLIQQDRVIGVLSVQSYRPNDYSPERIRLLEMIANHASTALQNARLFEKMRQMAITDDVTGLHTRRHFTTLAMTEVERALRYNHTTSALLIDIDLFKKVNDTYGHAAGDTVIQVVAQTCRQALRMVDIVGRWGGEEFCVLLPETDCAGAVQTAERIRGAVEATEIEILPDTRIKKTVSIGVAELQPGSTRLEDLVSQADTAMYRAKDAGRNQVVVY